ncbi:MAG: hypothetical protein LBQ77_07345 [Treponema sp.]|nr:hypothetical protein [Treponema sp.]
MFFVTVLFCLTFNLSAQNRQKIVPVDSEIYQAIKSLYIAQGLALPSTTGPWSEHELLLMLNRLDQSKLKHNEQRIYDVVYDELTTDNPAFKFSGELNLEMHGHSNTEYFVLPDDFVRPINTAAPFFALQSETWILPSTYSFFELQAANTVYNTTVSTKDGRGPYAGSTFFGAASFASNLVFIPPATLNDFSMNFPYRAFVAVGGNGWNVQVGRDRLSWGPGVTGNFMVGDHIQYHNTARASVYRDNLKYTFNISAFQSPFEYFDREQTVWNIARNSRGGGTDGYNLFIAHRVEWRTLKNTLNIALTEGLIYQTEDSFAPEVFNPVFFMHNLSRRKTTNSLITVEADFSPIPLLNIYGQLAVDEFAAPNEQGETTYPSALAYMLGVQTAFPVWNGMFSASFEWALTDPYLYLRYYGDSGQQRGTVGLTYVVANRYVTNDLEERYVEEFLGYRYGGDAIVFNARGGYNRIGVWNIQANLMVLIHGTHDKWTTWQEVYAQNSTNTPRDLSASTTSHDTENHADEAVALRTAASVLTALSLSGSWNFWKNLSVYGYTDLAFVAHKDNIYGRSTADIQFGFGLQYSF